MRLELKSFIADDGASISYVDVGSGRPLVYVNGFGEDASYANHLIERWSRDFRCVTFDHRGYGATTTLCDSCVERSARDLKNLLQVLGIDDARLVGYSMGGSVAFSYVKQFGTDHVERLVLADTSPKLINEDNWGLGLWQGRYTRDDFERDLATIKDDPTLFHLSFYGRAATKTSHDDNADFFPAYNDVEGWYHYVSELTRIRTSMLKRIFKFDYSDEMKQCERRYWASMTGGDWRSVLKVIDVPTLCLYADPGSFYYSATAEYMASQIPVADICAIENACHVCPKENLEVFASSISEFCSRGL